MMPLFRSLAVLGLVLALGVTTLAAGMARGEAAPVGTVPICRGLTVVDIAVDARGQPVSPLNLCADGLKALFGEAATPTPGVVAPVALQVLAWRVQAGLAPRGASLTPRARAPPLRG